LVARNYVHLPTTAATLEKCVAPWLALAGDVVTYTLTVAGSGELALPGGVLVDRLPPQIEVLDTAGAQYDAGTRELRWTFARLGVGQTVSVTFRARVAEGSTMAVAQNTATLSADTLAATAIATATLLVGER
jgi:uncharacterized repeat protein (TIGR01451 family)